MRRTTLALPLAAALVATALAAAPASAASAGEPRRDGDHFPVSVETTVPAGGSATVTTPSLGKDTKTVKVTVKPQADATGDEKDSVDDLTHVLGTMSKGRRLLLCVMLHQIVVAGGLFGYQARYSVHNASAALVMLGACLRLAGLVPSQSAERAARPSGLAASGRSCDVKKPKVPATLEEADGGYDLTVDGEVKKTTKPRLKVGCRVKGSRVIYKVRAATKGVPLRRVVGQRLSIGMSSPSDANTGAPVRVTFATP